MTPSATDLSAAALVKATNYKSGDPSLTLPEDVPTGPPVFENKHEERRYLKHRLALAFRVFAKFGFCEGIAGHITLRDPVDPRTFWVNPFGWFSQLNLLASDTLRSSLLPHHPRRSHSCEPRRKSHWRW